MPNMRRKLAVRTMGGLLHLFLFSFLSAVILTMGTWLYMQPLLPKLNTLDDFDLEIPLHIYSSEGDLMGEFGEKRRIPITYDSIPQDLIHCFLVAEDDRFFSHGGIDIAAIVRAFLQLLESGSIQSGGSTITMQVARNYLLTADRTLVRKIKEILLALKIEQKFNKEKILELYVNKIFLGKRAYGAEAAARTYYGKTLSDLNLAQYAMISGLPKAPSAYNPLANPERAISRRDWVLQRLRDLGYVTEKRYQQAKAQPITAARHTTLIDLEAPHAAEWARQIVIDRLYGLAAYTRGYKVYTTIRSDWQREARRSVIEGMFDYDWRHGWRGIKDRVVIGESTMTVTMGDTRLRFPAVDGDFPDITTRHRRSRTTGTVSIGLNSPPYGIEWPDEDDESANPLSAHVALSVADALEWQAQLKALPKYNNLIPAAVTSVAWRGVNVLLSDGSTHEMSWDQGFSTARRHITENEQGLAPSNSFGLLGLGDVIYLRRHEDKYQLRQLPEIRSALVSVDPNDGAVRTLVSGFDFNYDKYNNVIQSYRQPGSGVKPFVYTKALEEGFTAASLFNDAPLAFEDAVLEDVWRPSNEGDIFRGPTRMRVGLYRSINLVSIRILRAIGIDSAISSLRRFGFNTRDMQRDLSIVLGSQVVRPIDMARAYAVFANGGYLIDPYIIERIEDANGEVVYRAKPKRVPELECPDDTPEACEAYRILQYGLVDEEASGVAPRVVDERVHFIMDDMLRDVVRRGTARAARSLERGDIAGKTGTTNGPTDAWFSGYHPSMVTVVWLGFADNRAMGEREYGGSTALPIWTNTMRLMLADQPEYQPNQPNGVSVVRIDPVTGKLASSIQEDDDLEFFRSENVPKTTWSADDGGAALPNPALLEDGDDGRRPVDELF